VGDLPTPQTLKNRGLSQEQDKWEKGGEASYFLLEKSRSSIKFSEREQHLIKHLFNREGERHANI